MNLNNLTDLEILILMKKCERRLNRKKKIVDKHNQMVYSNICLSLTKQNYLTPEDREYLQEVGSF